MVQTDRQVNKHAKDMSATRQYVCIWWRRPRTDIKKGIFISGIPVILLFPPFFPISISYCLPAMHASRDQEDGLGKNEREERKKHAADR
jgi:hypothetical protein